jgi:chromosome segregation ATPase
MLGPDTETRELPCELTDAELLQRGDAMAECEMAIDKLKDKRSKLSKKIGEKRKERFELAEVIESGEEPRDVQCKWIEDFTHNLKRLIRQDTGKEVEQATMSAAERQLSMEAPGPDPDETIDLDDVPDDDADPDDDSDAEDDAREIDNQREPVPAAEPRKSKARARARQPQPNA